MSPATAPSGRLAVFLGPLEVAALTRARGSEKQTDYARTLIGRLVASPTSLRDRLADHPSPPLPFDTRHRERLDVRMDDALRRRLDSWCGPRLPVADAVRAAIHMDAAGALDGGRGDASRPDVALGAPPSSVQMGRSAGGNAPADSRSRPSRTRRKARKRRVEKPSPVAARDLAGSPARDPAPPPARSLHEQALERVAERVRSRRAADPFHDPLFGSSLTVEVHAGGEGDTAVLVDTVTEFPEDFLLAASWSDEVELEVARLLAYRPADVSLRILVGTANGQGDDGRDIVVPVGVEDAEEVVQRWADGSGPL